MKLSKNDYAFILTWAKKIKAINMLGNKCCQCGTDTIFVLDFHHNDSNKEQSIQSLRFKKWSIIEKELQKCMLLCRNCHMELHFKRHNPLKEKLLQLKKCNGCCDCGFRGIGSASLDFHHVDENNKEFGIARGYRDDRWMIPLDKIIVELDKCIVLCRNCHALKHMDIDRFNYFKTRIYDRVNNYQEKSNVNRQRLFELYKEGYGVCQISKMIGCSKSSVSLIINKHLPS